MLDAKKAVAMLLFLVGSGCSQGGVQVIPDSLAPIEPEIGLEVVWAKPVAPVQGGGYPLNLDPQTPCAMGANGSIVTFGAEDGSTINSSQTGRPTLSDAVCGEGVGVFIDSANRLVALGEDSSPLWEKRMRGTVSGMPAFIQGGRSIVVQDGSGRIASYDARNGEENWSFTAPANALRIEADSGPVLADQLVLAGLHNGKLYAIDRLTGLDVWEASVAVPTGTHEISRVVHVNPPAREGSVACASSYQGNLACMNLEDGRLIWSRQFSSTKKPVVGNGVVSALDEKDVVQAFSISNGEPLWANDTMKNRGLRLLGVSGRALLLGDYEGYAHALDSETGVALGRVRVADGALLSAGLRPDGSFVVRSADGVIARVRLSGI